MSIVPKQPFGFSGHNDQATLLRKENTSCAQAPDGIPWGPAGGSPHGLPSVGLSFFFVLTSLPGRRAIRFHGALALTL